MLVPKILMIAVKIAEYNIKKGFYPSTLKCNFGTVIFVMISLPSSKYKKNQ